MTAPRRLAVLLAVLATTVARPARAGEPERHLAPPPAAEPAPPGAERIEVHVRFPPWQFTGTFRLEGPGGALLDEGVARDQGGLSAGDGVIERVLEGAHGVLVLRVQGGVRTGGFPPIFGRWTVARGTGAWAGLAGGGTFTSCSSGAPTGSPYELQTLLGHVVRADQPRRRSSQSTRLSTIESRIDVPSGK